MVNAFELNLLQSILGLSPQTKASAQLQDVVFVCIDCEAYEFAQDKTTEIGISVLDIRRVRGVDPGVDGAEWLSQIDSAHYRIEEYSHLINSRWVQGDPDGFTFGTSAWISHSDASRLLAQIFRDPLDLSAKLRQITTKGPLRDVILVGHSMRNDIAYLKNVGFSLNEAGNIVRRMDTQTIAGSKKHQMALHQLLRALGVVPTSSLHNAGNDSAYTLRALMMMAVMEHTIPGVLAQKLTRQQTGGKAATGAEEGSNMKGSRKERKRLMRAQLTEAANECPKDGVATTCSITPEQEYVCGQDQHTSAS